MLDKLAEEYEKEYVSLIRLALNIVIVGEMLYKKYGYFRFNAHMVRVTCNSNFVLWIH